MPNLYFGVFLVFGSALIFFVAFVTFLVICISLIYICVPIFSILEIADPQHGNTTQK